MRSFLGITGHISFDGNNTLGLTARFALNNDQYCRLLCQHNLYRCTGYLNRHRRASVYCFINLTIQRQQSIIISVHY